MGCLRRGSAAGRFGIADSNALRAWKSVCRECCVLSGKVSATGQRSPTDCGVTECVQVRLYLSTLAMGQVEETV